MQIESAALGQVQQGDGDHAAEIEGKNQLGLRIGHRSGQLGRVQVLDADTAQTKLGRRIGDATEPQLFAGMVAVGHNQGDLDSARLQHPQTAVADIGIGKDDCLHRSIASACSTALTR